METLFASQNAPFSVALAIVVLIALMESIGLLLGVTVSGLVDSVLPDFDPPDLDVDVPDVDGPDLAAGASPAAPNVDVPFPDDGGFFTRVLGWLSFGRVPALIWLVIFLTAFGLSGLALQGLVSTALGFYLPAWIAPLPALALTLPVTGFLGRGMARILPRDESQAVSRDQFVGRIATIIRGLAARGSPAEAKLTDRHGQTHYVLVEPDIETETFSAGDRVLLVSRGHGGTFRAIVSDSAAFSDRL